MINNAPNGGIVTLDSTNVGIGGTILINKNLTIKSSTADSNINIFSISNYVFVGLKIGDNCKVNFKNLNFMGFKNYAISSGKMSVLSFDMCSFDSSRGGVDSRSSKLIFNHCEFINNFNNSVLKTIGDELTLFNCSFNSNNYVCGSGSCINGMNSNVSIDKCVFNANHADIRGGSISLDGDNYNLLVKNDSRVDGNSANGGGFLFTTGKNYDVRLLSSSFSNNRAVRDENSNSSSVNGVGGVILSTTTNSYNYLLSGNSIRDNVATGGGGLLACFREGGTFTFNGNNFADNYWFRNTVLQIEASNNIFNGSDIYGR